MFYIKESDKSDICRDMHDWKILHSEEDCEVEICTTCKSRLFFSHSITTEPNYSYIRKAFKRDFIQPSQKGYAHTQPKNTLLKECQVRIIDALRKKIS